MPMVELTYQASSLMLSTRGRDPLHYDGVMLKTLLTKSNTTHEGSG